MSENDKNIPALDAVKLGEGAERELAARELAALRQRVDAAESALEALKALREQKEIGKPAAGWRVQLEKLIFGE